MWKPPFSGWSPTTLALKRKNVEVLKAILSVPGLDLNLKTHKGSTVASMAVAQGESLSKEKCYDYNMMWRLCGDH